MLHFKVESRPELLTLLLYRCIIKTDSIDNYIAKGRCIVTNLVGIYYLLSSPRCAWLLAPILYLATDGAIHLLRDKLEGLGYQTSFSAKYGDIGLLACVLLGVAELRRDNVYVPVWLRDTGNQIELLMICIVIGAIVSFTTTGRRHGQWGDIYHDVVVAPFILLSAILLLPNLWFNGSWYELAFIAAMVIIWLRLVQHDLKSGRFVQRQYLLEKGFQLKGEVFRT